MSDEPLINGKEEGILAVTAALFRQGFVGSLGKDDAAAEFFAVYTARRKVKCRRIELDGRPCRHEEDFDPCRIVCIGGYIDILLPAN